MERGEEQSLLHIYYVAPDLSESRLGGREKKKAKIINGMGGKKKIGRRNRALFVFIPKNAVIKKNR